MLSDHMRPSIDAVRKFFIALQNEIVITLERLDGEAQFSNDDLPSPIAGMSRPRVLQEGKKIEKIGNEIH